MQNVITIDPQVMHGTACFAGTRVPAKSLFDHLEAGYNVEYFLEQFPSVKREQVLAVLEQSRSQAEASALVIKKLIMKLLLDENIPHGLRPLLMPMHEVFTVAFLGWNGIANGKLLALAASNDFDALITTDKGIEYQQDQANLRCAVVVLEAPSNTIADLKPIIPRLIKALEDLQPNSLVKVS